VHKSDLHLREARQDIGFREGGVEALVGDAVAIEDNSVVVFEVEGLGEGGKAEEGQQQKSSHGSQDYRYTFHFDSVARMTSTTSAIR
jgi:hypothetical protein